jgi:hypothetical protein
MKTSKELIEILVAGVHGMGTRDPERYMMSITVSNVLDIIEHLKGKAFSEYQSMASPPDVKPFSEEAFIDLHFKIQNALIEYRKKAKGQV